MQPPKSLSRTKWFPRIFVFWGAVIFILPAAVGQDQPQPSRSYTLEQAVDYALKNYPAVRASLERVAAAQAGVTVARAQYLPQLSGVYQDSRATQNQVLGIWLPTPITPTVEGPLGASSSGQSYWGSQAAALISWEPFDFGLRSARVGQAQSADAKSRADLALTELQVATAVGNYFLLAVANQQAVLAAQSNLNRWQEFTNSIHMLVDNQLRAGADASRADAELARAKIQVYRAQQEERAALDTLAALMGLAGNEIKLDQGVLLDVSSNASLPDVSASEHPLALDQMAEVKQIQSEEKVLQRMNYPRFSLQGEIFGRGSEISTNGAIAGNWNGLAPGRENWVAGITILFPDVISFKSLSAQKQISKANQLSQKAHYDQTIQDLTGQMQAARDQLKSAQFIAQETPVELAAARQSEAQSRSRYESGLATLVELAEAENLLSQAEIEDSIARLNVWHGLFAVAGAQGNLQNFIKILHGTPAGDH
jgi:outer membrane protein TolC